MKKNMGTIDRTIRVLVGILIAIAGYYYDIWLFYVVAGLTILTASISYCLPYELFGINTNKKQTN